MISIIVPVYNVENYLQATLDSILNSTYQDFEIILVDDGSTDDSGQICDQYAGFDHRIHVIHQANAGISAARNAGLSRATGEYIGFVDSDDLIHPHLFQVLYDAITSGDYDFSMVLGMIVADDFDYSDLKDKEISLIPPTSKLEKHDMLMGLMGATLEDYQFMVVWNKLYKRSFIHDLRFINTASEDLEWNSQVYMRMNSAVFVAAKLYYWVHHQASITHQPMSLVKIDRINSYLMVLDEIPSSMKQERSMCLEKIYKVLLHTRFHARDTQFCEKAEVQVEKAYKETVDEFWVSETPWPKKYGLLLFYHFPAIYRFFIKTSNCVAKLKG